MIYLASQSPRRRQLLQQLGVNFETLSVDVLERRKPDEAAADYVSRVAREKAQAGLASVSGDPDRLVLGADTDVVIDDTVLGKPADAEEAYAMLNALSGRSHQVITSVWLVSHSRQAHSQVSTEVRFAAMSDAEIHAYIATGEPFGKAGAYAVQGKAAAFIAAIEGSFSAVMGLPLHETYTMLRNFRVALWPNPA